MLNVMSEFMPVVRTESAPQEFYRIDIESEQ